MAPARLTRRTWLVGLLASAAGALAWRVLRRPGWHVHETRTTLGAAIDAEVFFENIAPWVRVGPKRLMVVRFNAPVSFVPHLATRHDRGPMPIGAWADLLGAPVVLNAGQFDERHRYLGWLKGEGQWLSATRKAPWLGLLATGPQDASDTGPFGAVFDLANASPRQMEALAERYQNVVQSMMLVDEDAQVRIRRSQWAACRTVVAEDHQGRLLIVMTEGAVTLYDLAQWLTQSSLHIRRAINLDGGAESQLAIRTPELTLTLYGQYGTESQVMGPKADGTHAPLPMVIAVVPARR
jgi:hypothetical protein